MANFILQSIISISLSFTHTPNHQDHISYWPESSDTQNATLTFLLLQKKKHRDTEEEKQGHKPSHNSQEQLNVKRAENANGIKSDSSRTERNRGSEAKINMIQTSSATGCLRDCAPSGSCAYLPTPSPLDCAGLFL